MATHTLPTELLTIHAACPTDTKRPALANIHVTQDHLEATDGHCLVRVKRPAHDDGATPLNVPASLAKDAAKAAKGGLVTFAVGADSLVTAELANGSRLAEKDGSSGIAYPDTEHVVDGALGATKAVTLYLDPFLLLRACQALGLEKAKGGKEQAGVRIEIPAPRPSGEADEAPVREWTVDAPLVIHAPGVAGFAIVMPQAAPKRR